jgi:phthalate 4,5-dioxygenase reductase subunit
MHHLDPSLPRLAVRVGAICDRTPRIREFELVADGADLPPFEAGAHIEVAVGGGATRSYSLANDPRETGRYVIAVLREPDGHGSGWLHGSVRAGDRLEIAGPRNAFPLREAAAEHILVAGGVGITPIRSMMRRPQAIGAPFRVIYCTRTAADTAYRAELLDACGPRLLLHHDEGDASRSLDLAAALRDRPAGAHVYVCGPRGLIQAARAATAHWPADTVHVELFASPPPPAADAPAVSEGDQPFEVVLARSGRTLHVPADKSILDMILAAGIKAPYVCREGWCGNCRTVLLGGRADHRDDILGDDEKAAQDTIHVCISRAMPGEQLILDR